MEQYKSSSKKPKMVVLTTVAAVVKKGRRKPMSMFLRVRAFVASTVRVVAVGRR